LSASLRLLLTLSSFDSASIPASIRSGSSIGFVKTGHRKVRFRFRLKGQRIELACFQQDHQWWYQSLDPQNVWPILKRMERFERSNHQNAPRSSVPVTEIRATLGQLPKLLSEINPCLNIINEGHVIDISDRACFEKIDERRSILGSCGRILFELGDEALGSGEPVVRHCAAMIGRWR